jgi:RimJ/RimL family protein N-acetyltransferase
VLLLTPSLERLPAYADALRRGWSPDNLRPEAAQEQLREIEGDPADFVARMTDREARGRPVRLPDGSLVQRLPGFSLWMWQDGFCGSINFRWQPGTERLPPHVMGHVGYAVVPWRRREGFATRALGAMRERVRAEGLRYADLTCDADNVASRKTIEANGGFPIGRFRKPDGWGGAESLLFRWYVGSPWPHEFETARLRLRQWRDTDRAAFAAMNADARVMEQFPAPLTREESDAMLERARTAIERRGWGNWAVERRDDAAFLGFVGLTVVRDEMPFAPAVEAGWRLAHPAWGQGYASEGGRAALRFAFETLGLERVVSFTASTNARSMAVMQRVGMARAGTFEHPALAPGHRLRPHVLYAMGPTSGVAA